MRLRVLGCSGGIGGSLRTTSMLLDDDVLLAAATGLGDLSINELARIDHVFVTHSHLDHVTSIPFMVDTVGWMRNNPITVHALPETLKILRLHLFNWKLWPDFTVIPDAANPVMRYAPFRTGETVRLGARAITSLPANPVVPAAGYRLDSGAASLVFTGDTTTCDALWAEVNRIGNLRYLIIETAFSNRERDLAVTSRHLCPSLLADELGKLKHPAQLFVTHLKPGEIELIMREIKASAGRWSPAMLQNNQVFDF